MRIACPACNAAYQVPDEHLRAGRVVRCARCGTDWAPIEHIPAAETEPDRETEPMPTGMAAAPELEPVVQARKMAIDEEIPIPRPPVLPEAPRRERGFPALALAWVLSLALVGSAVAALAVERDRVMSAWPPSIRGYAALGLAAKHSEP